jgi:hypothetical protein
MNGNIFKNLFKILRILLSNLKIKNNQNIIPNYRVNMRKKKKNKSKMEKA